MHRLEQLALDLGFLVEPVEETRQGRIVDFRWPQTASAQFRFMEWNTWHLYNMNSEAYWFGKPVGLADYREVEKAAYSMLQFASWYITNGESYQALLNERLVEEWSDPAVRLELRRQDEEDAAAYHEPVDLYYEASIIEEEMAIDMVNGHERYDADHVRRVAERVHLAAERVRFKEEVHGV